MSLYDNRSYSSNWRGKAKIRVRRMNDATYKLLNLLGDLGFPMQEHDWGYDWAEEIRGYVNRMLWAKKDKK